MTSFLLNKKSFFLQFMLYFSGALIVLGVIQTTIGTLRFYNASEQEYEKLAPKKVYPVTEIKPSVSHKAIIQETQREIMYYVAEDTNTALAPSSEKSQIPTIKTEPEKSVKKPVSAKNSNSKTGNTPLESQFDKNASRAGELVKTGNNVLWETQKESTIVSKTTKSPASTTKKEISPVEISVTPKKESAPKGYQETIGTVVTGKYFSDALWKFPIIIDTTRVEPRGQIYNESITLGIGMESLPEVSKVLVHEIGHMIDIYALKKNLRTSDPSNNFYKISWGDSTTIKAGIPKTAFISGYASTNQYEDFAESFTMYVFHNKEFQKRGNENEYLKEKYNFLKTQIFGDAFLGSSYEKETIPQKIWDVTRITLRGTNLDTIFAWINSMHTYRS